VLITENVAQWKRDRLVADGAIVKIVPILQVPNALPREAMYPSSHLFFSVFFFPPANSRWVDQFTKLQLWTLTEYDRIVYLDSDMLPMVNAEELFDLNLNQQSTTKPSFNYTFAAVPTLSGWNTKEAPRCGGGFNAGFLVLKPDRAVFDRIWEMAMDPKLGWNENYDMEQGLLNAFFAGKGHAPAHRLDWMWNAKGVPDVFLDRAKIVHSRYVYFLFVPNSRWWLNDPNIAGPRQSAEWWRTFGQVEGFWEGASSMHTSAP
jgi:alpha-N-acetylglucosamine transferase